MGVSVSFNAEGSIINCQGDTSTEVLYTLMMLGVHRPMTAVDWTATLEELAAMLPEVQRLLNEDDGRPENEPPE